MPDLAQALWKNIHSRPKPLNMFVFWNPVAHQKLPRLIYACSNVVEGVPQRTACA